MVTLLGFVALAVDVGMIATARTQCQNVADTAAMSAARTLNGDTGNNYNVDNAQPNAIAAASANTIGGNAVAGSQVAISIGLYTYNYSSNKFDRNTSSVAPGDTPNLVQATVTSTTPNAFARTFGINTFSTQAVAIAVHRPRDVAVVLDLSRSMRFDSMLGIPYYGTRQQSNNPEPVYPLFGPYSAKTTAALQAAGAGPTFVNSYAYGMANITVDTNSGTALVNDFHQNALGASPVAAFTPADDAYATAPGGDNPLYKLNVQSNGYAATVKDYLGTTTKNTAFETNGYNDQSHYNGSSMVKQPSKGYTQGPRYWGKTFFIWPPDPKNDWRTNYFDNAGTSTGVNSNTRLWDNTGSWTAPSSRTYSVNYNAVLAWIKTTPNPFPPQLRSGRILYYDSIPSTIHTSSLPPSDPNQRFWKEYIDWVLGVNQDYSSGSYTEMTDQTGYGDDYTWGTISINAKPTGADTRYMNYLDNPKRPKLHFWFGPTTMLDFLGSTNYGYENYPGNCHEAPNWQCKLGIQAAMQDIQNNHPNDFVSLMYYNTPNLNARDTGCFNSARVPLGRNYQMLNDTLWFPPSTIQNPGTEIRIYDPTNNDVPRATNGTSITSGLLLAYNQLSGNSTLRNFASSPAPTGQDGGYGRKGARKLVIFETDGIVNTPVTASLTNGGAYNSYYNVRQPTEFPVASGMAADQQTYAIANQICALDSASPPGYSSTMKPALIHCIGFGSIFEPSASSDPGAAANQSTALTLLQQLQYIGNTQSDPSTPLAPYKTITGTPQQRIDSLRQAFSTIMQDGVQVSLIQ